MGKAPSKIFPWRTAMMSLLFFSSLPSTVRVCAFLFANLGYAEATVCPHCKDTILPAGHVATACPLIAELNANAVIFTTKKLARTPVDMQCGCRMSFPPSSACRLRCAAG